MNVAYAHRVSLLSDPSAAEALVLAGKRGLISFGGGIPDPAVFPVDKIAGIVSEIMVESGDKVLQYGPTAGDLGLRKEIAKQVGQKWNKTIDPEEILITSGAQQAIDLIGKTFLNAGDRIIVEDPTYFVAISAFNSYEVDYQTVTLLEDGPDVDQFATYVRGSDRKNKFAYVIPTYHNPTGYCWSQKKRDEILEISRRYKMMIIEDDPYSELYFKVQPPLSLKAKDKTGHVVYVGSFSKILSPGIRIGYIIANRDIIEKLILVKQSMDLHTSSLSQEIVKRLLSDRAWYRSYLSMVRRHYKVKSNVMSDCLQKYVSGRVQWHKPDGGLFLWLKIMGTCSIDLAALAAKNGVSLMPGYPFYADSHTMNTIRLTYATATEDEIHKGIKILSRLISQ